MFTGSTLLALDGKGRLAIPTRHREKLLAAGEGRLVLTVDPAKGCLLLYPYPKWEDVAERLNALPSFDPYYGDLQMLVLGSAEEVEPDGTGRILISPVLRRFAKLDKSVALVGQVDKFTIWSEDAWMAKFEKTQQFAQELAVAAREGKLPEELKSFRL